MPRRTDTVPAAPFSAWLNDRLDALTADGAEAPAQALAEQVGLTDRWLRGYLRGTDSADRPTDVFERARVEDMLHRAGAVFTDVYPDLDPPAPVPRPERYCPTCKDAVSVDADNTCLWCDTATEELAGRAKQYCGRCDKMVLTARDGTCWRCGTTTRRAMPQDACGCGCGATFSRFDEHGRRRRWVRGHAPKPHMEAEVDIEPFAAYLEEQLRRLDPVDALARRFGISRDEVLHALQRRGPLPRDTVQKALRTAGQQGKGMPRLPGAATFSDLYPDIVRSRTCPDCGEGKAPHAERCKNCSRAHQSQTNRRQARSLLRADLADEGWRLHMQKGLTAKATADRLLDRTAYSSAESLRQALTRTWRSQGREPQRGVPIPDELLMAGHRLHERGGLSVDEVAGRLLGRTAHTTQTALRNALYRQFKAKGLRVYRGRRPLPWRR